LIEGKPVVYSGADRIDDGGRRADQKGRFVHCSTAAWGEEPANIPRGDWLLFAPGPTDEDDN
jgi:hypothetical protein